MQLQLFQERQEKKVAQLKAEVEKQGAEAEKERADVAKALPIFLTRNSKANMSTEL